MLDIHGLKLSNRIKRIRLREFFFNPDCNFITVFKNLFRTHRLMIN